LYSAAFFENELETNDAEPIKKVSEAASLATYGARSQKKVREVAP
jgi:hypothetical protein